MLWNTLPVKLRKLLPQSLIFKSSYLCNLMLILGLENLSLWQKLNSFHRNTELIYFILPFLPLLLLANPEQSLILEN